MNNDAQLLASLWESVHDHVSNGDKQEVAENIVRILIDHGSEFRSLIDAEGTCNYLDRALENVEAEEEAEHEPDLYDEYGEDE